MSLAYLSLDSALVAEVAKIGALEAEHYGKAMNIAMDMLAGTDVSETLSELAEAIGAPAAKLQKLCLSISTLLWECAKLAAKDLNTLRDILMQLGLGEELVTVFLKVFHENRKRILLLKGALGLSNYSYKDLAWRLDIELGRRSARHLTEPSFMLGLQLANNSADAITSGAAPFQTHHLQCSHANMKLLQTELQKAVDELAGVHCQRLTKYIS